MNPSDRLSNALRRIAREEKKSAAANKENEALRSEVRTLRHANFILRRNAENSTEGNYRTRYEKLEEVMKIVRELSLAGVNGIPNTPPKTLEPWLGPSWARSEMREQR